MISCLATRKCQKIQKNYENSQYQWSKSQHLLNDLKNFNKNFIKDVSYDNIKSHKKPGLPPLIRRYIFEKKKW